MLPPDLSGKSVLIVEDDEMSFLYLRQLFMLTKCLMFHASSGSEALQLFRLHRPDLILMDIHLPDMDGMAVTRQIRLNDRNIPIIAQTAGKTPEDKERALEAGCSEVIVKPFTMEELFAAIQRQLTGRR